jgi:hypothetical protein
MANSVKREVEYPTSGYIGFYHKHGYNIWDCDEGQLVEQLYEAGNDPLESTNIVPVERGESLETLHKFCEQTGKEMAEEAGVVWLGCSEEDE